MGGEHPKGGVQDPGAGIRLTDMRCLLSVILASLCVLLTGVAQASATSSGPRATSLDSDKVDEFVADYLDRHGLPAASIAVVRDGEVLHTAGYGEVDDDPVTAETPMAIASASKSFTAFAVLQLVGAGEVRLDEPVTAYLPDFELDDRRADDITVRQLLSHTSGLPNPLIVPPADTLAESVAHLDDWQLATDPGEQYAYSNANYHVAARLVEVVTGTPFATYLDEEVFAPLGMDDTVSASTTRDDVPGLGEGRITAYGLAIPAREMEKFIAGAGGIVTTAQDIAQWLALQTDDGRTSGGRELLPARLLTESHTPQPGADRYALGWRESSAGVDPQRISHAGSHSRANAEVDLVPSSGYGVAVMLDSFTPTFEHAYEISAGIIEITEGGSPSPGTPVATLIDLTLGALTVLVIALTVRGVRRSRRWAERRATWPLWRYLLRLLPLVIFPAVVVWVFGVLPVLEGNTATPLDALLLWPAAMVLLLALAGSGAVLLVQRGRLR